MLKLSEIKLFFHSGFAMFTQLNKIISQGYAVPPYPYFDLSFWSDLDHIEAFHALAGDWHMQQSIWIQAGCS